MVHEIELIKTRIETDFLSINGSGEDFDGFKLRHARDRIQLKNAPCIEYRLSDPVTVTHIMGGDRIVGVVLELYIVITDRFAHLIDSVKSFNRPKISQWLSEQLKEWMITTVYPTLASDIFLTSMGNPLRQYFGKASEDASVFVVSGVRINIEYIEDNS